MPLKALDACLLILRKKKLGFGDGVGFRRLIERALFQACFCGFEGCHQGYIIREEAYLVRLLKIPYYNYRRIMSKSSSVLKP